MSLNSRLSNMRLKRVGFVVFAMTITSLAWLTHSDAARFRNSISEQNLTRSKENGPQVKQTKRRDCPQCMPAGDQELYIPLTNLPEAEDGEIVFNSRSAETMSVTPIFYKSNGQSVICEQVQIQAGEIRYVPIKELLPRHYRGERSWGGFTLSFTGLPREMWSQFRFPHVNGGGSVDEFFTTKFEARSKSFEAAWWMPKRSETIIALGNITDHATSASVTFGNGHVRNVELAPHATEVLRESNHNENAESVRIAVTGAAGSVIPAGIITTKDGSFNSAIRFYDTAGAKQSRLFANGFGLRGVTPHMILKNTTTSSIAVLPKVMPLAGRAGLFTLPQVVLGPEEITEVDLSPLVLEARTRHDLDVISVEVENYSGAGSLIGSLYGVDERSGANYEVPLRDSGPIRSMAGLYPWKITDDFRTVVYITNITDQATEFVAEATYDGGRFTLSPRNLQPGETAVFDLEAMRRAGATDGAGRSWPSNVSTGQFKWGVHGLTNGKITVIGRAQMVSRAQRISSSYSCHPDCGPNYEQDVTPSSCDISTGESCTLTPHETLHYADGQTIGPYDANTSWSLENASLASFSYSGASATLTGSSPGSTLFHAGFGIQEVYDWDGYECIELYSYSPEIVGDLSVAASILKLQYQKPEGGNQDISTTLYVFKGSTVTFVAVPNPSGSAFPTGKPTWSGTSGASGTGTTTSVTFNTTSSSSSDFKTVIATDRNVVTANVIVLELTGTLTPDDAFTGRSTTNFGIHEHLTLSAGITPSGLSASQVGGIQWVQNAGSGTISAATDGTGTYNVADAPESVSLKLTMLGGPSKGAGLTKSISAVAPSGGYEVKFSGVRHFQNWWSCGFKGDVFILPTNVSFANLYFAEQDVGATTTGWLAFLNGQSHTPSVNGLRIGFGDINSGAKVAASGGDEIFGGKYRDVEHGAYAAGTLNWAIPWNYSISGGAGTWQTITTVNETASSTSTGKCTISKAGSGSVSKELADGDSEW
jgi:hypothetical protein